MAAWPTCPGCARPTSPGNGAFRQDSGLSPAEQAIVLLAISRANRCAYCVAAHSTAADIAKLPTEVTDALRAGDPLPDARLGALATFTTTMSTRGGCRRVPMSRR